MRKTPDTDEVRCTVSGCSCVCFKPGSVQPRSCDRCGHGWVAHALAKPQFQTPPASRRGPVEVALPGLVFDLSSLVLYGAQAVPVRLKILLDRLYSILTQDQVGHILHTLGWSLGDYVRGYMLQHPGGNVLDRWLMATPEEELLILKQFLRFGETRPIVELMTANPPSDPEINPAPKSHRSNIDTLAEQNGGTPEVFVNTRGDSHSVDSIGRFKKTSPADHNAIVRHLENVPGGPSLLLPFHFPSSALHCLGPPTEVLVPPSKLTQCLRKLSGTKLAKRHKIKDDPDKPIPAQSIWHPDQEIDFHWRKRENTLSLSPSLNSALIPSSSSSSSLQLSISSSSSSPPKISQKLQGSHSFSLNPLPSFSSSFLCPLPTSSFSSSLHPLPSSSSSLRPLPSSLSSLPSLSPVGGRKGRVCCGVCGKSFYDKGTLKIHYNAVHLKIKHRCTVAGCTMVFSSLRSRNRHSANPNPRLHTGASGDAHTHRNTHAGLNSETQLHTDKDARKDTSTCKETDISDTRWQQDEEANALVRQRALRHGLNGHSKRRNGCPLPGNLSQDTNNNVTCDRSNLHVQTLPPVFLPPARGASSPGSPPSLATPGAPMADETERRQRLLSFHTNQAAPAPLPGDAAVAATSCDSQPVSRARDFAEGKREEACSCDPLTGQQQRRRQWESGHLMPKKKKPRKSSMPVKIEREKMERERDAEKGPILSI